MPTWDELYADGFTISEPLPWVVEAIPTLRDAGVRDVWDLGCGLGRHLVRLGRAGFTLWGSDASPQGLRHSRAWLIREGLPARLARADMRLAPFAAAAFDAVVSTHVLYHATRAGMTQALGEVTRVLRPGGLFVGTLLSTRAWKHGEGEELEPNTFVQARGPEAGVPHHCSDEAEVRALLANFTILRLQLDEELDVAGDRHSHWEILARLRQSAETTSGE